MHKSEEEGEYERPDGLGMAIDIQGDIYEGIFKNGELAKPQMTSTESASK